MLSAEDFRRHARRSGGVDRRLFMAFVGSLTAAPLVRAADSIGSRSPLSDNPFQLGVASGDPNAHSVLLWTRLAPQPLKPAGGMTPEPVQVRWEIAEDDKFAKVVDKGRVTATPQLGHSVHVAADGLQPDHWYHYRFMVGDEVSPVGRTRTTPAAHATPERFKFAFASCQHYESGHYAAYRHMAEQDLDMVFHLGDYIYEGKAGNDGVRRHVGKEIESLDDYRIRHALYRSDPHLQAMHQQCPWMVTWDDHEFDNNCAGAISEKHGVDPVEFLIRRANSYQAYYEAMPLRRRSLPTGPDMRLYRKLSFGNLADMLVLDTRQYRSDQPNDDRGHAINDDCRSPAATMLGQSQRQWLESSLLQSQSKWNVLAQQVMMGTVDHRKGEKQEFSMDQWAGYLHERNGLMSFLAERRVPNPVVITGDIHSNWVNDLRVDDFDAGAPVVATEFVGTSISSGGNGPEDSKAMEQLQRENPCVKFHDRQRGYVACELNADEWRSDYFVVDDVTKADSKVEKLATFAVAAGRRGAERA